MEVSCHLHTPAALPGRKDPTVPIGWAPEPVWVLSLPLSEIESHSPTPQLSHYTDWAILASTKDSYYKRLCLYVKAHIAIFSLYLVSHDRALRVDHQFDKWWFRLYGTPENPIFDIGQRASGLLFHYRALEFWLTSIALKYVLYKENVANLEWTSLSALVLEVDIQHVTGGTEGFGHMDQQQRYSQVQRRHYCCVIAGTSHIVTLLALTDSVSNCWLVSVQ